MTTILDLPNEVLNHVFGFCRKLREYQVLLRTCRRFHPLAEKQLYRIGRHIAVKYGMENLATLQIVFGYGFVQPSFNQVLMACRRGGHVEVVDYLLQCDNFREKVINYDTESWRSKGYSPLHIACSNGHFELVEYFLALHGMDINHQSGHKGMTPLHGAVASKRPDMITFLMKRGASAEIPKGRSGDSPLHMAIEFNYLEVMRRCLEAGADPNFPSAGIRPFVYAMRCGRPEAAKLLLQHGADLYIIEDASHLHCDIQTSPTPAIVIQISLTVGDTNHSMKFEERLPQAITWMPMGFCQAYAAQLATLEVDEEDTGLTAKHYAAERDLETLRLFYNLPVSTRQGAVPENTLLHHARSSAVVQFLLNQGHDPNIKDQTGDTALMAILRHKREVQEFEEALVLLLEQGADVNIRADNGQSVLEIAIEDLQYAEMIVGHLLQARLDIQAVQRNCMYGFFPWIGSQDDIPMSVIDILIKGGADLEELDENGRTILFNLFLYLNHGVAFEIMKAGADVAKTDWMGNTMLHAAVLGFRGLQSMQVIECLLQQGADPNTKSLSLVSPFDMAIQNGDPVLIRLLLQHGADAESPSDFLTHDNSISSLTSTHLLVLLFHYKYMLKNRCVSALKVLVERGVNIDTLDGSQQTPLQLATMYDCTSLIHPLIDAGAKMFAVDNSRDGVSVAYESYYRVRLRLDMDSRYWQAICRRQITWLPKYLGDAHNGRWPY